MTDQNQIEVKFKNIKAIRQAKISGPKVVRRDAEVTEPVVKNISSRLQLQYVSASDDNKEKIRVFINRHSAQKHILKHVLGHGESSMWSLLFPEQSCLIERLLSSRNGKHVSLKDLSMDELQILYDNYANIIGLEIKAAELFGTVIKDSISTMYVGLTGLFIVVRSNVIRTAYYPMWSDSKRFIEFDLVSCDKKVRDKKRRQKAMRKRCSKGTPERRIYNSGLRATVTMFRKTTAADRDFSAKQQLVKLVTNNMPIKYHEWLPEYLSLHIKAKCTDSLKVA